MLIPIMETDMASRPFFAATCLLLTTACGSAPAPEQSKAAVDTAVAGGETAPIRLRPGLWRRSQSAELTAALGPAQPVCITPEQALTANGSDAQIRAAIAEQVARDGCTLQSVNINGPTVAFTEMCSGAALTLSVEYRGDSSTSTTTGGGTPPVVSEGVRVGDC